MAGHGRQTHVCESFWVELRLASSCQCIYFRRSPGIILKAFALLFIFVFCLAYFFFGKFVFSALAMAMHCIFVFCLWRHFCFRRWPLAFTFCLGIILYISEFCPHLARGICVHHEMVPNCWFLFPASARRFLFPPFYFRRSLAFYFRRLPHCPVYIFPAFARSDHNFQGCIFIF